MTNNTAALERGFKKAKQIMRERIEQCLVNEANKLAMKAYESYNSPLMGFTGNTWTGTAVGAYSNGKLIYIITTRMIDNMPAPVMNKLRLGKPVFLEKPYGYIMDESGGDRSFIPTVDTDGGNSEKDAIEFLESHSIDSKYGITVVNGSEYANYIENSMGGDVIIGTHHYAGRLRAIDLSVK